MIPGRVAPQPQPAPPPPPPADRARISAFDGPNVLVGAPLVARLEQLRAQARKRRRRIRLPLLAVAGTLLVASFIAQATTGSSVVGAMLGGPCYWLLLLCSLPSEPRSVALGVGGALVILSYFVYTLALRVATRGHNSFGLLTDLLNCAAPTERRTIDACERIRAFDLFAACVSAVAWLFTSYCALALAIGMREAARPPPRRVSALRRMLPSRQPHAVLDWVWQTAAAVFLSQFVIALCYAAIWLVDPEGTAAATGVRLHRLAGRLTVDALVYLLYALEMAAIGGLSAWPGLRARVHAALAARGESVATAAGIGALIVGCDSDHLAAVARDTFRYVRLNELKPWHLSGNAETAFALSAPAQLGSIDAFVTHSWRDDPRTKYRLLQAWRSRFMAAHGREPTVWLDVCCLDPQRPGSFVPCLPVYLAGCHSLLALCGPTFLGRLWCCIELFVFSEMRPAGAHGIEIVRFDFECATSAPRPTVRLPSADEFRLGVRQVGLGGNHEMLDAPPTWTEPTADSLIDVRNATCSLQRDRQILLGVIENCGAGGADAFNVWLRKQFPSIGPASPQRPSTFPHRYRTWPAPLFPPPPVQT